MATATPSNSNSSAWQLQITYTTGTGTFQITKVLGKRTDGYTSNGNVGLKVTVATSDSNSSNVINTQTDTVTAYFGNGSFSGDSYWKFNGSNFAHSQVSGITASTVYVYITITSTFNSKIPVNSYWKFSTSITPATRTVTIAHWSGGWLYGEGDNGNHTAYHLQDTSFTATPGSSVTFNDARGITPPRGFYLGANCGSSGYNNGTWTSYTKPVTLTQPNANTTMEYDYYMSGYNIKYDLNGGTNNANNPSSYVAPYGVNLQTPTRTGYTFDGWTLVYDVKNLTLTAGSSDNYKWEVIYGNVQPGEDITVKIANASLTSGSATNFTIRMYDFTSSADVGSIVNNHCTFESAQEYHFIAPSSLDGTHQVALIIYAGISGSTANNTATFKGITVSVKNTTKINRGENITFSSVSDLTNKLRYKNIFNVLCIANWVQAEGYINKTLLPSTYTQVDYIESTGTQYIDTLYYHKTNLTDYEIDFVPTDVSIQYQTALGARTTYNGTEAYFLGWGSAAPSGFAYCNVGGSYNSFINLVLIPNRKYNIKINAATGILVNDCAFTYNPYKTAVTHSETDLLFAMKQGDSPIELAKMKLYRCKISESGTIQHDFIPCYRNSDDEPGLYDLATDTFFTNSGTGTFTLGPVTKWQKGKIFTKSESAWVPAKKIYNKDSTFGGKVDLSIYTPITYISSGANNGYINLNFSDVDGVKVIAKLKYDSLARQFGTIIGAQDAVDAKTSGANALIIQNNTNPWLIWYAGTGTANYNSHFQLNYPAFIIESSTIKNNSYIKIGDAVQTFTDTSGRGTQSLYVFALNNGGSPGYYAQGTIYWLKVYDHTGTLVRDLIPCKRNSDDIVGLYDLVNNYFYVTQSDGAFVGGNELSDWHEGRNE